MRSRHFLRSPVRAAAFATAIRGIPSCRVVVALRQGLCPVDNLAGAQWLARWVAVSRLPFTLKERNGELDHRMDLPERISEGLSQTVSTQRMPDQCPYCWQTDRHEPIAFDEAILAHTQQGHRPHIRGGQLKERFWAAVISASEVLSPPFTVSTRSWRRESRAMLVILSRSWLECSIWK